MKSAVVFGSGGFIGRYLARRLKDEGYWVRGVDLRPSPEADEEIQADLRDRATVERALDIDPDEVYQLAADMGGAGYLFTGDHDAGVMHNSALINLHTADACRRRRIRRLFYSSSACIYPKRNQQDPLAPDCTETTAYPADPDSEYGWEKLFSERLYQAFARNHGLDVRIGRLHNVYGPGNPWQGGREKAPAALCRKIAEARDGGVVEIWGDGRQTRSFLYVDDCVDGIRALMASALVEPANIGSEEMIGINDLASLIMRTAGRTQTIRNVPGPVGVRGRTSDNGLLHRATGWRPRVTLEEGIARTYAWVAAQVAAAAPRMQALPTLDAV